MWSEGVSPWKTAPDHRVLWKSAQTGSIRDFSSRISHRILGLPGVRGGLGHPKWFDGYSTG